jgi:hypothetical protein
MNVWSTAEKEIYEGLDGLSQEELIVALLIARLKTLTTIKTQNIVYGLTYIASKNSQSLLKPLTWAFKHYTLLLPIHRAFLLQLIVTTFDRGEVPSYLLGVLIQNYPTGYFLEDRVVYDLMEDKLEVPKPPNVLLLESDQLDLDFLRRYHSKYKILNMLRGVSMQGVTNSFRAKRKKIQEDYVPHYSDQVSHLVTHLVPNSDAMYTIANTQFYEALWNASDHEYYPYFPYLHFLLDEMVFMVGSVGPRPEQVPTLETVLNDFEVQEVTAPYPTTGWEILASSEEVVVGERYSNKQFYAITTCHCVGDKTPDITTRIYSRVPLILGSHFSTDPHGIDQPVSQVDISDFFEEISMSFLSPYALYALGLDISSSPHQGLNATNTQGEVVVKSVVWKEQYEGTIDKGTEYPLIAGHCVMIRSDYYKKLMELYSQPVWKVVEKIERSF